MGNIFEQFNVPTGEEGNIFAQFNAPPPAKSSIARQLADIPIGVAGGVAGLINAGVGLGDIATGGKVGDVVNAVGDVADKVGVPAYLRPTQWQDKIQSFYTPEMQTSKAAQHQAAVDAETQAKTEGAGAWGQIGAGALGALQGVVQNPRAGLAFISENIGGMKAIAKGTEKVLARYLPEIDAAVKAGTMTQAQADARIADLAGKISPVGEGVLTMGQNAQQVREENPNATAGDYLLQVPAGIITGAIAHGVGRIPGLENAETTMALNALGRKSSITGDAAKRAAKGILSEGVLQEVPQSAQEQVWQNLATGKSWQEGVGEQAVQGLVAGGAMGGGAAGMSAFVKPAATERKKGPANEGAQAGPTEQASAPVAPAAAAGIGGGTAQAMGKIGQPAAALDEDGRQASAVPAPIGNQPNHVVPSVPVQGNPSSIADTVAAAVAAEAAANPIPNEQAPVAVAPLVAPNTPAAPESITTPVSTAAPIAQTNQAEPAGVPVSVDPEREQRARLYDNMAAEREAIGTPESLLKAVEYRQTAANIRAGGAASPIRKGTPHSGTQTQEAISPTPGRAAQPPEVSGAGVAPPVSGKIRDASKAESSVADKAPAMLDLHRNPTGWKQVEHPNGDGVSLISQDGKKAVDFPSENKRSGTAALRAKVLAHGFAIDHPYTVEAPKGDLVIRPIHRTPVSDRLAGLVAKAGDAQLAKMAENQNQAISGAAKAEIARRPGIPAGTQRRSQEKQSPIMRRDDLVGAILRVTGGDGIAANMAQTIGGDSAPKLTKLRGLFTNKGTSDLGDVAMLLREEEGYDVRDGAHLSELIRDASFGKMTFSMARQEQEKETAKELEYRERIRARAKKLGIKAVAVKFSDLDSRVLAAEQARHELAVEKLTERDRKRFEAAVKQLDGLVSDAEVKAVLQDVGARGMSGLEKWKEALVLLRQFADDARSRELQGELDRAIPTTEEPDWFKDFDEPSDSADGAGGAPVADHAGGRSGESGAEPSGQRDERGSEVRTGNEGGGQGDREAAPGELELTGQTPGASAAPAATLSYEEFSKRYRDAFANSMRYSPNEVGSALFSERMAKLSDDYPEFLARLEAEEESKAEPEISLPGQAPEDFALAGQSPADLAKQEAKRVAAEKAKAAEAAKEVAAKTAAEKQALADKIKARAENPDNFQFGEDAKAAAKPMGGLFDQAPASAEDLGSLFDRTLNDVFGEETNPKTPAANGTKSLSAVSKARKETRPRAASVAAASAAKNAGMGLKDVAAGLNALFKPKPGTLGMGVPFNEDTYAAAKPYFMAGIQHFKQAGADIAEMMKSLITTLRDQFGMDRETIDNMKPYVVQFMADAQAGKLNYDEVPSGESNVAGKTGIQDGSGAGKVQEVGEGGNAQAGGTGGNSVNQSSGPDAEGVEGLPPQNAEGTGGDGTVSGVREPAAVKDVGGSGTVLTGGNALAGQPGASGEGIPDDVPARSLGNYHIADPESLVGGSPRVRFARNKAAIETFQNVSAEGRAPTADERDTIARFIGWGSFGQELFQGNWRNRSPKPEWKEADAWLREHLGKEEWESAQASIINAHYTDPPTVQTMWDMVKQMGFTGGRVLEPSMGIGNFFGMMPRDMMERSQLTGIEMETLTGGMAKMLYPDANIQIKPYQDSKTSDGFYDLVIGNWPFAAQSPLDRRYMRLSPTLHDYFFLKALDQVRAGGLVVGITSSGTMDKVGEASRYAIAKKADLIGAFRLPSGAFEKYAGTSVVTDILVFQKRDNDNPNASTVNWLKTKETPTPQGTPVKVNAYFADNPQFVLGTTNYGHGTTRGIPGMIVDRPSDMMGRLKSIPEQLPADTYAPSITGAHLSFISNHTNDRQQSITIGPDNGLYVVNGEHLKPLHEEVQYRLKDEKKTAAREAQIRALIELRKAYAGLIDAERLGGETAEPLRTKLSGLYKGFVKAHGIINESDGLKVFQKAKDPFYPSLAALEVKSDNGYRPAMILSRPTMRAAQALADPTVEDAFVLARNKSMNLDMAALAKDAAVTVEEATKTLLDAGAIFKTPVGNYEVADVYLSGNVRRKTHEAEAALNDGDQDMANNIAALKKVTPPDEPYYRIEAKLGAPWVPATHYRTFISEMLGVTGTDVNDIKVENRMGRWIVQFANPRFNQRPEASSVWGSAAYPFSKLVRAAMNNTSVTIRVRDNHGNLVVSPGLTDEVNTKIGNLREHFSSWIWSDIDRRTALEKEYNEVMRAVAAPRFDGSFLRLEGMALQRGTQEFSLRAHQVDAIWRGLVNQMGIYAHEVGTGKTYTMAGLAVESRRYGLAKKPLIFAHNANSASVAREFQEMYPAAKVLYIDNLSPGTISTTMRQIANDDWDAVVVPHSLIERFALTKQSLDAIAAEEISMLEEEAQLAASEDNSSLTVGMMDDEEAMKRVRSQTAKELVKARNLILARIAKMAAQSSREDAIAFEDLGVDMIIVDEAHEFKKPPLVTRMKMKGLNKGASGMSVSLRFLTDYVKQQNNGKGVHLFTGTPITNTLAEIYNMQRYVADNQMSRDGVKDWDSWFSTFADSMSDVELTSTGEYDAVTRLSMFINTADLRNMIGVYTDIVFADDMPEFVPRHTEGGKTLNSDDLTDSDKDFLLNGKVENPVGRPYKKIINDVAEMTDEQLEYLQTLQARATAFKSAQPRERKRMSQEGHLNAPILIDNQAPAVGLDPRLFDLSSSDHPNLKVNRAAKNILTHFNEDKLATQVVFVERGYVDNVERNVRDDGGWPLRTPDRKPIKGVFPTFNLVKDLVDKLVNGGIPRNQIAIIDGTTSGKRRQEVSDEMNAGTIRVVIGMTKTLGVGVNMQKHLRALHHLDAPWMPGDLEQRNGRGQRQGNQWNTLFEYRYITDRVDGRRWQVLAIKERFIKQFLKANTETRIIEGDSVSDEDDTDIMSTLSEAAGDPRIMIRQKLKKEVERLEKRAYMHDMGRIDSERRYQTLKYDVREMEGIAAKIDTDIAASKPLLEKGKFSITIDGKTFTERHPADEAIKAFVDGMNMFRSGHKLGSIGPFKITLDVRAGSLFGTIEGRGGLTYEVKPSVASIESVLRNLQGRAENYAAQIDDKRRSIPRLLESARAPFPRAEILAQKKKLLQQVEADLSANPIPPPPWLRQGAPIDTLVYVNGKEYVVEGHHHGQDGFFVIIATPKGSRRLHYGMAKDSQGMDLYEAHLFQRPVTVAPTFKKDDEVISKSGREFVILEQPTLQDGILIVRVKEKSSGIVEEVRVDELKRAGIQLQPIPLFDGSKDVEPDIAASKHEQEQANQIQEAAMSGALEGEQRLARYDYQDKLATESGALPGESRFSQSGPSTITPADSAIYSMAQEGKTAAEILSFIGKASRRPFNRYLANALARIGVSSSITLDSMGGWQFNHSKQGAKYAAAYNPKTDVVALFTPREAERHILHELTHAATLKAIAKGGAAALQMRALFKHVQRSGELSGQYGMSNLDEFVAEAFSNPTFQQALKSVPAPKGSSLQNAWQWFVRAVARILGLKTAAQETALDRAMTVGAQLMRENAELAGDAGGAVRHSFAGESAQGYSALSLRLAQKGVAAGKDVDAVRQKTGWFKGLDGRWRFEINDSDASLKNLRMEDGKAWRADSLDSILDHPALFAAYPALRNVDVQLTIDSTMRGEEGGEFSEGRRRTKALLGNPPKIIVSARSKDRALSILLHEVQHGIQNIEGFATGGNPGIMQATNQLNMAFIRRISEWNDYMLQNGYPARDLIDTDPDVIRFNGDVKDQIQEQGGWLMEQSEKSKSDSDWLSESDIEAIQDRILGADWLVGSEVVEDGYSTYRRLAGEVEARNVQARRELSAEDRKRIAPDRTQDVPSKDVVVVFNGKEMKSAPRPANVDTLPPTITIDGTERPTTNSKGHPIAQDEAGVRRFWEWFAGSKAVDEQGLPLAVYHATGKDIGKEGFDTGESRADATTSPDALGAWIAEDVLLTERIHEIRQEEAGYDGEEYNGRTYELYTSIKNPFVVSSRAKLDSLVPVGGTTADLKRKLSGEGFDGIEVLDDYQMGRSFVAFRPEQIKSATGNTGEFSPDNPDIRFNIAGNPPAVAPPVAPGNLWQRAKAKAAAVLSPENLDKAIYELQDKYIDLKRLRDHIKAIGGTITDMNDAYLGEELYHKRLAYRSERFEKDELLPLMADLKAKGITTDELETFLHARHAPEANAEMAKRNPNQAEIDAGQIKAAKMVRNLELRLQRAKARGLATVAVESALNNARGELANWNGAQAFQGTEAERRSLSGMSDAAAATIMAGLTPERRSDLNALAARVDAINEGTLKLLDTYGLMSKASLNEWRNKYQHYIPLHRDEAHPDSVSHPIGQGFSTRGDAAKRRTGSNQKVTHILGHIAMQREAALTRGEKNHVMLKLYLMARQNPLPDVWKVGAVPTIDTIDKKTGFVSSVPDPLYKNRPNVVMLRIAGKDVAIAMNEHNPEALRMAQALKNLDVDDLHYLIPVVGKVTRWFAAMNTQYNPIFGVINLMRDTQEAALNLSSTELAGKQGEVLKDQLSILKEVLKNGGRMPKVGKWAALFAEFNEVGGTTGYRDLYLDAEARGKALLNTLESLDRGKASQAAHAVADWLSDYNEAMENATRLAAYKAALDSGMSKERSASLAKNLTVNFNRKGRQTRELGALYAFFNAAVQGTARMAQTLSGPAGRKIIAGGVMLGALNALMGIAMMGGGGDDDDEWDKIPDFVKQRSIIIPIGKQDYISIPMPLGFQFLPNIGRLAVEMAVYKDKTAGKQMAALFSVLAEAFNPLGGNAPLMQIIAPTVMDPFVALAQNKDWTGKPIFIENRNSLDPQPGMRRAKDSATPWAKGFAEAINAITGGTEYTPGGWSPTPDQIDYVIGQLTGGVGREAGKVAATAAAPFTGEELPPYKIPLVGRLYGSTAGHSGQSERFYENITRANEAENEIKGRAKDGFNVAEYLRDNPGAIELAARGNVAEKQVSLLRRMRHEETKADRQDSVAKVRAINEQMSGVMRSFNRDVTRIGAQ